MPYVHENNKPYAEAGDVRLPGDLNYAITCLLDKHVKDNGLSYKSINSAIGAIECAKQEFYRRVAVPYEEKKLAKNGDVYSPETLGETEDEA